MDKVPCILKGTQLYLGTPSATDKDTATARTAVPVPPACGIYYFEVEIAGKAQKRYIHVSLCYELLLTEQPIVMLPLGSDSRI